VADTNTGRRVTEAKAVHELDAGREQFNQLAEAAGGGSSHCTTNSALPPFIAKIAGTALTSDFLLFAGPIDTYVVQAFFDVLAPAELDVRLFRGLLRDRKRPIPTVRVERFETSIGRTRSVRCCGLRNKQSAG
jgi:hypothetical protein